MIANGDSVDKKFPDAPYDQVGDFSLVVVAEIEKNSHKWYRITHVQALWKCSGTQFSEINIKELLENLALGYLYYGSTNNEQHIDD